MAKSKSGGTRALLRGRVGSDVYSVGKDGMGKRQQVVRSLAEVVANPRTENQMFGRMIMSTVMQAVSAMSPIIDHSFDGHAKGQPSISEFIRRNYALVKADALAHPASDNTFGLNKYQEKGAKLGKWKVSHGVAVIPSAISNTNGSISITLTADTATVGGLKAALGSLVDGYLTIVGFDQTTQDFVYGRAKLNTSLADSTVLTAENVPGMFSWEGNQSFKASFLNNKVFLGLSTDDGLDCSGLIISQKVDGGYIHNSVQLDTPDSADYDADTALPTYPVGNENYLNGGEL